MDGDKGPSGRGQDAMIFCSQAFLVFFALVFLVYWILPWDRARVRLLLIASFYFYARWNSMLAVLIGVSTAIDFLIALGIDSNVSERRRKILLVMSLTGNLGLLIYFKYANFFLDSFEDLLHLLGVRASLPLLKVIVPIGISFYTFEAINYMVEVYRRNVRAERNLEHFLLFITFFPHLVAGPIVRARDFLPQIRRPKHWDWARAQLGVQLFLMGLFKKLAIADRMAVFSDPVFAQPEAYGAYAVWVAVLAYALQIYCDFSGYTDMALGCAHLLGYKLSPNFNMPYLARNVSDFWRRWHISLSSWLRDYLFIPLGGSRQGPWRTDRNLLLTMTLGGLWHGPNWTFVAWGALHGALLVGHRRFREALRDRPAWEDLMESVPGTILRVLLTFACVCVGWIFFRAPDFTTAITLLARLLPHTGDMPPAPTSSFWATLTLVIVCHALGSRGHWPTIRSRIPAPVLGFGYASAFSVALLLAPEASKAFVYFQF